MFDQKFDMDKIQKLAEMTGVSFDEVSEPRGNDYGDRIENYGEFLKDGGSTGLGIQEIIYRDSRKEFKLDSRKEFKLVCHGKKNKTLSEILQVEVTRLEESLGKKKNKKAETHRKNIQFIAMLARTNNLIGQEDNTTQDQFNALVEGVKKRQGRNEKIKFPGVIKMDMLTEFERTSSKLNRKLNRKWIRLLRVRLLEASEKEKEENSEYAIEKEIHGKNRRFLGKIKDVIGYAKDGDDVLDSLLTDIEKRQKGRVLDIGNSDDQRKLQEIERKVLEDEVKNIKITRSRLAFTRIGAGGDFSEVLPLKALNILSELLKKGSAGDLEFNKKVESLKQLENCSGKADGFDSKVTETCKGWIKSKLRQLEKKELKKQVGLFTDATRAEINRNVLKSAIEVVEKIENIEQMEALQGWVTAVEQRQQYPGMDLSKYVQEFNDLNKKSGEKKLDHLKEMKDMMQVHPDIMPLLVKEENKKPSKSISIKRREANIECLKLASRMQTKIDDGIYQKFIISVKEKQDQGGLNLSNSIFYLKAIEKLESAKEGLPNGLYQEVLNKLIHELYTSIQESNETKTEFIYDQTSEGLGRDAVVMTMKNGKVDLYMRDKPENLRKGANSLYGVLMKIEGRSEKPTNLGLVRNREGLEGYKHRVVIHLGDPLESLDRENFKTAMKEGSIQALSAIGDAGISAEEGELNGDFKLDNILFSEKGDRKWSVIDRDFEQDETPASVMTGMLLSSSDKFKSEREMESSRSGSSLTSSGTGNSLTSSGSGNSLTSSKSGSSLTSSKSGSSLTSSESEDSLTTSDLEIRPTLMRSFSNVINEDHGIIVESPFTKYQNEVQYETAEMVAELADEINRKEGVDHISNGLTTMGAILGENQVVHDSWAFCTVGRMMAKRSLDEIPGDKGAKHLEQACIEKQKEILIELAKKMKRIHGKGNATNRHIKRILTELSTEFGPDKVRDEVIKRAKHLEKCEAIIHAKDLAEWMKDGHKELTERRYELIEELHNHELKEGAKETESDPSSDMHQKIRKHLSKEFNLMHKSVYEEYLGSIEKHDNKEGLSTEINDYFKSLSLESDLDDDFNARHAEKRKALEEASEKVREFTDELEKVKRGHRKDKPDHPIVEISESKGNLITIRRFSQELQLIAQTENHNDARKQG
ncbi:MAG: hypothetical protein VX737_03945 [Pseudomonadota bacterium]|nr:hypothetical protein [Pseudomonadota bacterium]